MTGSVAVDQQVLLIAGATASGKSLYALDLARRHNGVIINADSMQVYDGLRILTARPSLQEERLAPHRLYGHVPTAHAYSVGQWVVDAEREIRAAVAAGQKAIVVGGTGLYFKALLEGLSPIPEIPAAIRAHWRAEAGRLQPQVLHDILLTRDPKAADVLRPSDPQRMVRALEVMEATGRSIVDWQREPGVGAITDLSVETVLVHRPRDEIVRRADARLERMMAIGALQEVEAMAAQGLEPGLPAMRALGVRPLMAFLAGEMDRDEAIAATKHETRRYVKRQQTWQRRYMIAWNRIELV